MDISAIAATVTGCLAPALPYLAKASEQGTETMGEKLGSGTWETAKALWRLLNPIIEANPVMAAAVRDMADEPDDTEAQAALRFQLKKLLAADEQLAAALQQLVEDAGQSTS